MWDIDVFDSTDEAPNPSELTSAELVTTFVNGLERARQVLDKPVDWSYKSVKVAGLSPKLDGDWRPLKT